MLSALKTAAIGFVMGSADVVPGVSGGTIALVAGIYERLVSNIRSGSSALGRLVKGDFAGSARHFRSVEWGFLLSILGGILAAVLTLSRVIEVQLEERPVILAAAFFGLVLGSVVVAFRLLKVPAPMHMVLVVGSGALVFWLLGLGTSSNVADPSLLVFFGSGALAICAMILPGISGSLILVMIGMYQAVLGAVNDREYLTVLVFVSGTVVGLAFFSQLLDRALTRWHDNVLALLIGLMLGSLRIVWPWPDGVDGPVLGAPSGDIAPSLIAAVIGFAAVLVIARLGEQSSDQPALERGRAGSR